MGGFQLSRLAKADFIEIGQFTVRQFGPIQASRYLTDLDTFFELLAEVPGVGRSCDDIRPGLFRAEKAQHVVFFRRLPEGIFVVRVLHKTMLSDRHAFDDDDDVQA